MERKRNNRRYPAQKFSKYMRVCKDCKEIFMTEWRGCKTCPDCLIINEKRRLENQMRTLELKYPSQPTNLTNT